MNPPTRVPLLLGLMLLAMSLGVSSGSGEGVMGAIDNERLAPTDNPLHAPAGPTGVDGATERGSSGAGSGPVASRGGATDTPDIDLPGSDDRDAPGGSDPTSTDAATVDPALGSGWRVVFDDQFDGDAVDRNKWTPEFSSFGSGNDELQCHRPENAVVKDGQLHLTARREPNVCAGGRTYGFSSGMLRTEDTFTQAFGKFEMRARLPRGRGLLSAFWLRSADKPYGTGGRSGELDIVEVLGQDPSTVTGAAHWSHRPCGNDCAKFGGPWRLPAGSTDDGFHTYGLIWEPGRLVWTVDDRVWMELGDRVGHRWGTAARRPAPDSATYPAPFDASNPMELVVNLSVGGTWPGPPDESTPFPAEMTVDWVKVSTR